jgi:uncharacterized coiled-coil protein SlyX
VFLVKPENEGAALTEENLDMEKARKALNYVMNKLFNFTDDAIKKTRRAHLKVVK